MREGRLRKHGEGVDEAEKLIMHIKSKGVKNTAKRSVMFVLGERETISLVVPILRLLDF